MLTSFAHIQEVKTLININTIFITLFLAIDVMDLAWSPDSSQLASCSVDNTIIVWNATCLPNVTAILRGHNGLVKGVTWDPVGKYLASQVGWLVGRLVGGG